MAAKYVLGVQTLQLSQITLHHFESLGLFTQPLPTPPIQLPRLVDYRDGLVLRIARSGSARNAASIPCPPKSTEFAPSFML